MLCMSMHPSEVFGLVWAGVWYTGVVWFAALPHYCTHVNLHPPPREHVAVARSAGFRLFCCMNPATDVGKKQLPPSIRTRFTEFFVDEVQSQADLWVLVHGYLKTSFPSPQLVDGIIK